jgi:hypothetical protein
MSSIHHCVSIRGAMRNASIRACFPWIMIIVIVLPHWLARPIRLSMETTLLMRTVRVREIWTLVHDDGAEALLAAQRGTTP